MSRSRAGIGAELVPLVLILAGLAGATALIVSAHRRASARPAVKASVVTVFETPRPAPPPRPMPIVEEAPEPEPPLPPIPPDPTPSALARLTSAEAEQLLEASKADRKAAALEAARAAAAAEAARWRRRQSLVHGQVGALDDRARRLEAEVAALALERDALERELDARKAAVARSKSRPGRAILPHKGPNGTWRRPIVVECRNGMAILQPRGIEFGLMDLETGFGPGSNPFVAAIAREAIRIQGKTSPDGQSVVPYIFFIVRPDGIRPYYEARGRLEPLGITFGYELADRDWEIDIPDLDDVAAWDGSAVDRPDRRPTLARPGGGPPGEEDDLPSAWSTARRGEARGSALGGSSRTPPSRFFGRDGPWSGPARSGGDAASPAGLGDSPRDPGDGPPSREGGGDDRPRAGLAGRPARTWGDVAPAGDSSSSNPSRTGGAIDRSPGLTRGDFDASGPRSDARSGPVGDIDREFIWPKGATGDKWSDRSAGPIDDGTDANPASPGSVDPSEIGSGADQSRASRSSRLDQSPAGRNPADRRMAGRAQTSGDGAPTDATPPPGNLAIGTPPPVRPSPGMTPPALAASSPSSGRASLPPLPEPRRVDRTFEVVVVCNPRGVTVYPGGYRVTSEALKDRDGLFKKQVVGLVKGQRAADPKVMVEPRVRFLVQPGGAETYRVARGQFLLSGLDWPATTQYADPDPVAIRPSEGW